MTSFPERATPRARRAFTLVELIVASMVAAFLLTAVTFSLSRLGEARNLATERAEAFQRAATALESVRREVAAVIRSDDLFDTRLLIAPPSSQGFGEGLLRSDVLLFSNSMRSMRTIDYQGEGREYESQFRIEEDALGTALWHRRDNVPDEVPDGGGLATPVADGVLSVVVEASDGESGWRDEWDSDVDGLPRMVRISVTATGAPLGAEPTDNTPEVLLRTVVAVDRVVPPKSEAPPPTEEGMGGTESQGASGTGPAGVGDAGPAGGGGTGPLPDDAGTGGRPSTGGSGGGRPSTGGSGGGRPSTGGSGGRPMPGGPRQGGPR
jgi:prepilin-type N-terminal cleavage/methylation domain-containing protein